MSTDRTGHTRRGNWSQPGVPQRGWSCVDDYDLGEPSHLCEMCESIEIRFVHEMEHPDYPNRLRVGCVCAEHMEQDYVRPRERESRMKNIARRRKSWSCRIWKISAQGNSYINTNGFNIAIFPRRGGWCVRIKNRSTAGEQLGKRTFPTIEEAKLRALDALIWAKDHLG